MNSKMLKEVIDVISYIPNLPGAAHKVVNPFSVEKLCNQVEFDTREKCINAFCFAECGRQPNETCPNTDSCVCECNKYDRFFKAIEGE